MLLRLATRASQLAIAQSTWVADQLMRHHSQVRVELYHVVSTGDRVQDRPLHEIGGKGLFTKEVELALLAGEADFAVHSYKDVPVTMPLVDSAELVVAAVPLRELAGDVVLTRGGAVAIMDLPEGARVGTTSLRRRAILLDVRQDLKVESLRGNVDSRRQKLFDGEFDAIVLAAAGLARLGVEIGIAPGSTLGQSAGASEGDDVPAASGKCVEPLLTPAAGQGALAVQCRGDRADVRQVLAALHSEATARSVAFEREVIRRLNGDCSSPIGAFHDGETLHIAVGREGGHPPVLRRSGGGSQPVETALSRLSAVPGA